LVCVCCDLWRKLFVADIVVISLFNSLSEHIVAISSIIFKLAFQSSNTLNLRIAEMRSGRPHRMCLHEVYIFLDYCWTVIHSLMHSPLRVDVDTTITTQSNAQLRMTHSNSSATTLMMTKAAEIHTNVCEWMRRRHHDKSS